MSEEEDIAEAALVSIVERPLVAEEAGFQEGGVIVLCHRGSHLVMVRIGSLVQSQKDFHTGGESQEQTWWLRVPMSTKGKSD
jgi:hypothetical protein